MNTMTANYIYSRMQAENTISRIKKLAKEENSFMNELSGFFDNEEPSAEAENFEDMYYRSDYDPFCDGAEFGRRVDDNEDIIKITLTKNELPEFMDMALEELAKGTSLEEICEMQLKKDVKNSRFSGSEYKMLDCREADTFCIDKTTGEVTFGFQKNRGIGGFADADGEEADRQTVHKIADDLYTFLRYAAFPREEDDPGRVERLFEYIKEKQKTYSVTRFDPLFDPDHYLSGFNIIPEITAEEDEKQEKEPIDDFMETLRIHQEKLNELRDMLSPGEEKESGIWNEDGLNRSLGQMYTKSIKEHIITKYRLP